MELHVFARTPTTDYVSVEVGNEASVATLKGAIVAELKLDIALHRVRLLREVAGENPVLLDSRKSLMEEGVLDRSSVTVVEIAPMIPSSDQPVHAVSNSVVTSLAPPALVAAAPLPPPLVFSEVVLVGDPYMVADLQGTPGILSPRPFYLTPREYMMLATFIDSPKTDLPKWLLLTGPIKSGKTAIAQSILPRLLSAKYHAALQQYSSEPNAPTPPHRPVIHAFTFSTGVHAEGAAGALVDSLLTRAAQLRVPLTRPIGPALDILPAVVAALGEAVQDEGGELWLILDELGAPIVASTPPDALAFSRVLKRILEVSAPYVKCVGTGSGMVALLQAIRTTPANGFLLWGVIRHVCLGSEPPPAVARAMAQGLYASFSHNWPPDAAGDGNSGAGGIAPPPLWQSALHNLARTAHNDVTSPRPALLAYFFASVGDARERLGNKAAPEAVLAGAVQTVLRKLLEESLEDTIVGLRRMQRLDLQHLRVLADTGKLPSTAGQSLVELADLLRDESTGHLLPPYGAMLREFVQHNGRLSVAFDPVDGKLDWDSSTRNNLTAFHTLYQHIDPSVIIETSSAVIELLENNHIGVASVKGGCTAPRTVEEVVGIPAIRSLLSTLDFEETLRSKREKRSATSLMVEKVLATKHGSFERKDFMRKVGVHIVLWLRHLKAHISFPVTAIPTNGFSSQVVGEVVQAVAESFAGLQGDTFVLDKDLVLQLREILPGSPPPFRSPTIPTKKGGGGHRSLLGAAKPSK